MLVLEKCDQELSNTIIVPASAYIKNFITHPHNTIKDVLRNSTLKAAQPSTAKEFDFIINDDNYYTSILCDFSLFFARAELQRSAYATSYTRMPSSWRFVTLYYMAFFAATAINRIFAKGYIYINKELSSELSIILSAHTGITTVIESGNYKFRKKISQEPTIILNPDGRGAHEATWASLLDTFQSILLKKAFGYDKDYYRELVNYMRTSDYPPSKYRNRINYDSKIGIDELTSNFHFLYEISLSDESVEDYLLSNIVTRELYEDTSALFFDFIFRYAKNIYSEIFKKAKKKDHLGRALHHFILHLK